MLDDLSRLARTDFADIVTSSQLVYRRAGLAEKARLHLRDGTYIDLWVNPAGTRYSLHWEHRAKRGLIHRHDNAPDHPGLTTFPKHFHNGSESRVEESHLSDDPATALRQFLSFVGEKLDEFAQ